MDKKNMTYELRIKAIIDEAQRNLGAFEKQLKTTWENGLPPKHMSKSLEGIRARLTSLQEIAKKGVVDSSDLAIAESDYKAFAKTIHDLSVEFKLLTADQKKAMLNEEEQRAMANRTAALKAYNEELKKSREILAKREAIKKDRVALEESQKSARGSAQITLQDYGKRKENLEKTGPVFSPAAKEYVATLEEQSKLLDEIKIKEAAIEKLKKAGRRTDRDNSLTQAIKDLDELQNKYKKLYNETGKSDYDKAMSKYVESVAEVDKAIEQARAEIDAMDGELKSFDKKLEKLPIPDTNKAFADLKKELKDLGVEGIEDAKSIDEVKKAIEKLNGKALQRVDDNIAKVEKELEQLGAQGQKAKNGIDQATQAIKEQEEAARQQEAFENKIKQFLGLAGAAQVLRSALRNALSTITELDKTMTEMAVVTDLTVGDYWDQLPEYSKRASELGVSINSAYQAATLYYQQGLKTNEVNAISTETLKMARIAGLSAEDATNKMTAALRGFNMELNETSAQKISDVYSELAAITAADTKEIASAMTKTASIASSAGMEFETTAAFLSQIIETTRESAETAGTAMKTVIARFQELKKAPDEIGEVDGEIVDANKIETALRSVGVALRDASGQFRNLDEVFLELSSKWDTLDTNTQRYIATIAAGSRQQSRFIAMMSDYGRTQELVTAANNSAGASNKQFEKTMDSLASKVEELKNAWREFSMGIVNSELVKTGVEILTKFLNIINEMTGALDGVQGSAMKLISVISLFKLGQKIFDKFKNPLIKMFSDIVPIAHQGGLDAGRAFSEGVKEAKEELEGKKQESKNTENKQEQKKQTIGSLTGVNDLWSGAKGIAGGFKVDKKAAAAEREKLQQNLAKIEAERAARSPNLAKYDSGEIKTKKGELYKKNSPQYKKALKEANGTEEQKAEYDAAKQALEDFDNKQKEVQENAKKGWEQAGQGLQKMGATVAAVGIGVSAFGGILSSLGLEEVGEGFTQVGNILTLVGAGISAVGTALKAIPPLLTLISTHPIIAIIVAVLAVVLISITAIVTAIKNASPETKLKKAQEAAENAAEAADAAAEAYDKLAESLDSLDDKYKALEDLTRGTKEWNEAVRGINSSVLDLISEYPELAKFVENKEGVLTIDVESTQVQDVLNDAEMRKITSKNNSIMANIEVAQAQSAVDYKNLSDDAKFGLGKANAAYGGAMLGTMKAGALTGAGTGALVGNFIPIPGVGAAIGAAVGSAVGAIGGVVGGLFTGEAAKDAVLEQTRKDTNDLAKMLASGEIIVQDGTYKAGSKTLDELGYTQEQLDAFYNEVGDATDELMKYGESLVAIDLQQQAAYDAIASSAQQLADTLGMTEEQIRQSAVVADGDLAGQFYQEVKNDLDEKYDDMSDKDFAKDIDVQEAIKKQYGDTAKIDKNGKVTYRKDNEDVEVTVTKEEVLGWMATQAATEKTTAAIEFSDEAITKVGAAVGSEAIGNLYDQSEGKGLTQADISTLQDALKKGTLDKVWKNMSDDEKLVYGNDINNLIEDLEEGVGFATKSFEKAGDAARDFMTADMAQGFKEKLDEVASMAGGTEAYESVKKATDELLKEQDTETKQAIQSRINMTDWSNLEELLALQLDLELQYGYTTEEAKAYVDELGQAAFATSGLTTVVQKFGEVYQATQRVSQSLQRLSDLQWEYNRALKDGGNIKAITEKMLDEYSSQATGYEEAYNAGLDNLATIYASGAVDYGVDLRKFVKLGENGVEFDKEAFRMDEAVAAGAVSEADAQKFIDELTKQYETNQSNLDGLRKTLDSIEELEEEQKQSYDEIRDLAEEAITDHLQKQIDLQQEALDAEATANEKLINKLQEQINEDRRREQEEKAKENIADLQQQYAYLSRDTTGANSLQMLDLESQIEQAEEDYTDSLIDTMLSDMQNANQKAEEQRQQQIDISQAQLQAYTDSAVFQNDIDAAVKDMLNGTNPELKELITGSMTKGMSSQEATEWVNDFQAKLGNARSWLDTNWEEGKDTLKGKISSITDAINTLAENLTLDAEGKALQGKREKLERAGFNREQLNAMSAEKIDSLTQFTSREKSPESFGSRYTNLHSVDNSTLSRQEHYASLLESGKDPTKWQTYDEYLTEKKDTVSSDLVDNMAGYFQSNFRAYQNRNSDPTYSSALKQYESLGGKQTDFDSKIQSAMQANSDTIRLNDFQVFNQKGAWSGIDFADLIDPDIHAAEKGSVSLDGKNRNIDIKAVAPTGDQSTNNSYFKLGKKAADNGIGLSELFWYNNKGYVLFGRLTAREYQIENLWDQIPHSKQLSNTDFYAFPLITDLSQYEKISRFKTGGLADFTGPAWLDGTKSQPELVLNARDTQNFIVLKDILADIMSDTNTNSKSSGNNYFEIEINVDNISDDYDVEQLADKIRSMIYEDSIYRNVNAINHIR